MIISSTSTNWIFDPQRFINFDNSKLRDDILLCYGNDFHNINKLNEIKNINIKNKIFYNMEEPNYFFVENWNKNILPIINQTFNKILVPCRYTSSFFDNREYTYIPIDIEISFSNEEKIYDVIYTGHYYDFEPLNIIFSVLNLYNHKKSTPNNTYYDKMKWIGQSKISLIQNILYYPTINHFNSFKNSSIYHLFNTNNGEYIPQLKSRLFEAAVSKSLILCYKDNYNLIEDFFTPNVDFVYFENYDDCVNKINSILNNYIDYSDMIESAYNKVVNNYNINNFIDKINNIFE